MKAIPLYSRNGKLEQVTLVDDQDFEKYGNRIWYTYKKSGYARYCYRPGGRKGKLVTVFLHREILGLPRSYDGRILADHINGNTLDNRRSNLRIADLSVNGHNSKLRKDNTSGYRGVVWHRQQNKWRSRLRYQNKTIELGLYRDLDEAISAVKSAEALLFQNMPNRTNP